SRLSLARTLKACDCVIDVSGNASSAGTPSAPTASGPRSSQTSSTRPAATKDDATRAPPSTSSRVMPFSASACSTANKSNPGGGVVVVATRITCAPAAPSFIAAGASDRLDCLPPRGGFPPRYHQGGGTGQPQRAVQHHPYRRLLRHAGQAACQQRIIRQHGADADHNGVALRAQQ